jgi:integrase
LVTSDQLYLLGIELMDTAIAKAGDSTAISKATAMQYRDGLLIALLSVLALRRRTVTALKSGGQLLRSGNLRTIEIPPEDVKGKRALDFTLSLRLSECVDLYLRKFRPRLPGAICHDGFWPSNKGGPMSANAIYDAVCKRTESAFGFRVNPHRFRHAAGTLWSYASNVFRIFDRRSSRTRKPRASLLAGLGSLALNSPEAIRRAKAA